MAVAEAPGAGRRFAEPENLAGIVRAVFGHRRGGSKKGVYRLTFDDGATAISYVWAAAENYWSAAQHQAGESHADPFSDASGADLFEASHTRLGALGVRVPQVYLLDRSRTTYPADIALVEDVRGGTLETRLERGVAGPDQALPRLGAAIAVMHQHRGQRLGKLAFVGSGNAGQDGSAQDDTQQDDAGQDGSAPDDTAPDDTHWGHFG